MWLIAAEDLDPDAGEDGVGDGDGDEGDDEKTRRAINLCFIKAGDGVAAVAPAT